MDVHENHAPDEDEIEAVIIVTSSKTAEHPEAPPAQMIGAELQEVAKSTLSQILERRNLTKSIQRAKNKCVPPNPKSLDELEDLLEKYKLTASNENLFMYDSLDDDIYDSGRILMFVTRENLRKLMGCLM